jgi:Skp family chaperone for outer membrane proteins
MSKIFSLPPKIQPAADIQLPPNFELYSKNIEKVEEINLNLPARLGENNPSIFPSVASSPISFEGSEMGRLNLDNLLNPHKNDIDFMEKELKEYRQQVQLKNEEFKSLERQRNEIKSFSQGDGGQNYDYIQQQQEAKQAELQRIKAEKQAIMNALRSKQTGIHESRVVQSQAPPQYNPPPTHYQQPPQVQQQPAEINVSYDDFFDRKEIIQEVASQPIQQFSQPVRQQSYHSPTYQPSNVQTFAAPRPSGTTFVNQIPPQQAQGYPSNPANASYGQQPRQGYF